MKAFSGVLNSYCFLGTLPLVPKGQSAFLLGAFIFRQRDELTAKKKKKNLCTINHVIFYSSWLCFFFFFGMLCVYVQVCMRGYAFVCACVCVSVSPCLCAEVRGQHWVSVIITFHFIVLRHDPTVSEAP